MQTEIYYSSNSKKGTFLVRYAFTGVKIPFCENDRDVQRLMNNEELVSLLRGDSDFVKIEQEYRHRLSERGKGQSGRLLSDDQSDKLHNIIQRYNNNISEEPRVRWCVCKDGILSEILNIEKIKSLEENVKTEKNGFFKTDFSKNDATDNEVKAYIQRCEQEKSYLVFYCEQCRTWKCSELKWHLRQCQCSCGRVYHYNDNNVKYFEGNNAWENAMMKLGELNQAPQTEPAPMPMREHEATLNQFFHYHGKPYTINLPDFQCLHQKLYEGCALDKVLTIKNGGEFGDRITFTTEYENYLINFYREGILQNYYPELADKMQYDAVSALEEYNCPENDGQRMMFAFYRYLMDFHLLQCNYLSWRVGEKNYLFRTLREFAEGIVSCGDEEVFHYITMFNPYTCRNFFQGYIGNDLSELSRLVYDQLQKFVYFKTTDGIATKTDFGSDYISSLSNFDQYVSIRSEFMQAILDNANFWEEVKGNFYDPYFFNGDEIYDTVCFYKFKIEGERELIYKQLKVENSPDGFKYICNIIVDAYSKKDRQSMENYKTLRELFKSNLLDEMCQLNFEEMSGFLRTLKDDLENCDAPPIISYLGCCNKLGINVDKNTVFCYRDKVLTMSRHLQQIYENRPSELSDFMNSDDIKTFLEFVLKAKGIVEKEKTAKEEYKKILQGVEKIRKDREKEKEKRIRELIAGRITGSKVKSDDKIINKISKENTDNEWA